MELTPAISDPLVSAAHVDCISKVVYSAQKLLDHMFGLHFRDDGESLIPNLPTVFFARSLYAWITLVRVAAVGNAVCDEQSLRIEEYLERLGQVLDEAASMHHFHTAMSISPSQPCPHYMLVQSHLYISFSFPDPFLHSFVICSLLTFLEFSWILRILKQCYKHKRGGVALKSDFTLQSPSNPQYTPRPSLPEPDSSGPTSTSTLPPPETDFLAELDFSGQNIQLGDGIDWDAMMNDRDWWSTISGGWNDGVLDEQSSR